MAQHGSRRQELADNLAAVRQRIRQAEEAAGRPAGSVTLLPVTKFHPVADVAVLGQLGVRQVAENREQEARAKAAELPDMGFVMIGQVQTKKANSVARWAQAVHSVDSVKLAAALDRGVQRAWADGQRAQGAILDCFVQVSADGDPARGGAATGDVEAVAQAILAAEGLALRGLMCVPPLGAQPEVVFSELRQRIDALSLTLGTPLQMSAGMTADLDEAIAAGTDIVRVGTAIMGPRPIA
ncbi:YggS family pyridoxal phosphate-dependent enzyme [Corynebacterium uberis]|uniref:YggS family pyridoxal phosphate-dependent enzyme n=1 Tax=Corynebacterium uberis TaxID=2883169 RepID=UPI001D0B70A0|nr:YggS family pyridoxal phosphate-dependent enzyme [Corynebacterium uberis]UDL73987.1 YggS family pyridoxal phosphate-dependent enzyme [Corynebacterium uberis]UDL75129.1 YggS family pyridoxal phosphate-dependent enzyme [Corynebacterium uberis]UDL77342.1 YggS family pyridoxal phosphate-dependent enzyme [Corynebacterium uberis]UDL79626.1 YggS family pyridoxal phosphate-dependent enzyme [Corynebacterium uberis]UDL81759.1 YggS family pyridoxal phosphate-dependent enzyme [Corynebacterium uberis]